MPEPPPPLTRCLITLLLRAAVGLPLLSQGLNGFWAGYAGRGNVYSGFELVSQATPYVQIVVALAVILGFLTTAAAAATVVIGSLPALVQTAVMLAGGVLTPTGAFNSSFYLESLIRSGASGGPLPSVALVWLSSVGWNGWSLDGLIFGPVRGRRQQGGAEPPKSAGAD